MGILVVQSPEHRWILRLVPLINQGSRNNSRTILFSVGLRK